MPCPMSNCCHNVCIQVVFCPGSAGDRSGLSTTVKFNGTTIKTGTTDSNGKLCFPNTHGAGTYAATVTWNGITKTVSAAIGAPADNATVVTVHFVDSITVTVLGCTGPISPAATVSIPGCGSGTTNGSGQFTCVPTTDVYASGVTITVTWQTRVQTATVSGDNACQPSFQYVDRFCVQVNDGCSVGGSPTVPMPSATVTIVANGHTFADVTTDGTGLACLPQPLEYGLVPHLTSGYAGDAFSITTTKTNYSNGTASGTVSCVSPAATISITPDASHCCQELQSLPGGAIQCHATGGTVYGTTLHITDPQGAVTLTMGGGLNSGPGTNGGCNWVGSAPRTAANASHISCDLPISASVPVSFGFDGRLVYIACDPTNCWGTTCPAANLAGTAKTAIGSMTPIDSPHFSGVTYTVNSCDPLDLTVTFQATGALGQIVGYGCNGLVTLHLTV